MASSAPKAMNLATVSGVAATRRSSAAVSRRTAILVTRSAGDEQNNDEGQNEAADRAPFEQRYEPLIGLLMGFKVGALAVRHYPRPHSRQATQPPNGGRAPPTPARPASVKHQPLSRFLPCEAIIVPLQDGSRD